MKIQKSRVTFIVILAAVVAALTTAAVFMAKAYAKRRCLSACPEDHYELDSDYDVNDEDVDLSSEDEAAQTYDEQGEDNENE